MTEKIELHGHELEFQKNSGKAVIEIDLGEVSDECYLVDVFSVDGTDYVALISSESNEIYIFYYEDSFENDEIDLKVVDDEEELDEVFHLFTHYWDDESLDKLVDDYDNDIEHFADDEQVIEDNDTLDE
ncbi:MULTISPECIES: DUF1292 domain-containing protein [Anaerococcus]|jgi:hypothetical protein|uniref:DUF1292 domain-containing protein n=1 Tax=Anaerococcus octavius TaxID=54007 RepID=A0A2I1M9S2_9FIRM|nr:MULTISPECIES: DUF1292 domain-containing protein [Anaerococcus]MBS6105750.1 DUF1292 domain-containing protein [Anaerococcus sp.]MDU2598496.1 DUF1292 domain-containing protein [Anaerococcus sp.]MDU3176279.1 DUF1292 domain-containing protein [Anaerococcus sp.]MDU4025418.1 DUF1292 domain-containing protein [Anaerococcus sp.]PKZ16903.1 DUF1292 domain-containing protein [Anaerococcus octavius]